MKCADLPVINIKIKCLSFHAVFAPTIIIKANTSGYGVHGIILVSSDNEVKKAVGMENQKDGALWQLRNTFNFC